ncbi:hypothetical protein CKO44_00085 [Rubrivivax gelatinosus]|nr:tetratricopeptide repeat protein [Rubrivivax gelatinosus]MBK1611868.1 hypothetical protein [Rubrivivax gelatinosus]
MRRSSAFRRFRLAALVLCCAVAGAADKTEAGLRAAEDGAGQGLHADGATPAEPLLLLASWLAARDRHAEAVPFWRRAVILLEPGGGVAWAEALGALAESLAFTGEYDEARALAQRSVDQLTADAPDSPELAQAQYRLGEIMQELGDGSRAQSLFDAALALQQRVLGEHAPQSGVTLTARGWSRLQQGDVPGAMSDYRRAHALLEAAGALWRADLARVVNDIGVVHENLGDYRGAVPFSEQALALREEAVGPDSASVAQSLNNLAGLYEALGEYDRAITLYSRSLAINERLRGPEHPEVASVLQNFALVHYRRGDYSEALSMAEKALAIDERAFGARHHHVAMDLGTVAAIHRELGDYGAALQRAERAWELLREHHGERHRRVAIALNNVASLQVLLGRNEEARRGYERSLAVKRAVLGTGDPSLAVTLTGIAHIDLDAGALASAQTGLEEALQIRQEALGPEHPDVSESLTNLARLHLRQHTPEKALPLLLRAERIAVAAGAAPQQWRAEAGLFEAYDAIRDPELAIFWGKQAVNGLQEARGRIGVLPAELRRGFLNSKRGTYAALADRLVAAGRLVEAQEVLGMLKDDELNDFTVRAASSPHGAARASYVGPAETAARQRWQAIASQVAALGRDAGDLNRKTPLGLTPEEHAQLRRIEQDLIIANREFDRFLADLSREFAAAGPARAEDLGARQLRNLVVLQDVLSKLGRDTALLHYVVSDRRVAIIVTTADVQIARESLVPAAEINRQVQRFRESVASRGDVLPVARQLYRVLFAPVEDDLRQAGIRMLMLSLDGTLRYLPFAALHDGEHWLAERFALALYTEAARTRLEREPTRAWTVTGLGVARSLPGFAPLPTVREELRAVRRAIPQGEVFLDEQFTTERLREALARSRTVLHVASHFQFRPGTYVNSFLLLGDGTRLSLQNIREQRLRFSNTQLLTLSACDTGMGGGRDETGAEVEGFGVLAQQQGAASVLATLWPVADLSTARFMERLYKVRTADSRMTMAQALQRTQLDFAGFGRVTSADDSRSERRWAHPFYWAPYVLMGSWR